MASWSLTESPLGGSVAIAIDSSSASHGLHHPDIIMYESPPNDWTSADLELRMGELAINKDPVVVFSKGTQAAGLPSIYCPIDQLAHLETNGFAAPPVLYASEEYPGSSTPSLSGASSDSLSDGDSNDSDVESDNGGVAVSAEVLTDADDDDDDVTVSVKPRTSWYPEWRDEVVRRIDHFYELPATMRWVPVRDGIKVYAFSIHYMREFLWRHSDVTDNKLFIQAIGNFQYAMSDWLSWDAVTALIRGNEVSQTISGIVDQFKVTWDLAIGKWRNFPLPKWTTVFQIALELDREDMSLVIHKLMSSTATKNEILNLDGDDLSRLLDRLQCLIDAKCTNHRFLERLLVRLVRRKGVIPPHLIVHGVSRFGTNPIAGGGFADVWQGTLNSKPVALKVLRLFGRPQDRQATFQAFCKEAMVWRLFKHDNVCPFYGVCVDVFAPQYAFVSPWMPNGDMMSFLKSYPETDRIRLLGEVAMGLCYLHGFHPRVIHGDLRGTNVLMDADRRPRVADFGLSRVIDSQASTMAGTSFTGKGSMRWQAPELLGTIRFDGVFTDEIPWFNLRDGGVIMEVLVHHRRPQRPSEPALQRGLTDDVWELMQSCWMTNANARPEMREVVSHLVADHKWSKSRENSFDIHDPLQLSLRRCSALERSEALSGNLLMNI